MLSVGDGHWLYVEEVGRKGGRPALFLHGGPGSGAQHAHRALFDPNRDHAILFDQRGAGRSHPYLSRAANTTQHLVADIETIREHLKIEKWLVVGGSWGSTLALAYAEAHPERVTGLVMRAIFLGSRREIEWAFVRAPLTLHGELFQEFSRLAARSGTQRPDRSLPPPPARSRPQRPRPRRARLACLRTCALRTRAGERRDPGCVSARRVDAANPDPRSALHRATISSSNQASCWPTRIASRDIPGVIVQSRYDLLCPPGNAFALAAAWPAARLQIIEGAGHAMTEPGVTEAMRAAIAELSEGR